MRSLLFSAVVKDIFLFHKCILYLFHYYHTNSLNCCFSILKKSFSTILFIFFIHFHCMFMDVTYWNHMESISITILRWKQANLIKVYVVLIEHVVVFILRKKRMNIFRHIYYIKITKSLKHRSSPQIKTFKWFDLFQIKMIAGKGFGLLIFNDLR